MEKPRVLITGITGYLGSRTALEALKSYKYRVRGTLRNKEDPAKQKLLRDAFGSYFENLELASADLLNDASIKAAVKGN